MLKKCLIIILKIIFCLIFIISLPITAYLILANGLHPFFAFIIFSISLTLLFPISSNLFPSRWSISKKIMIYFLGSCFLIGVLQVGTILQDKVRKEHRYGYHLGYGLGPYRLLTQNEPIQLVLKKALSFLPYSTQYIVFAAEDSSRVFKIKNDFNNSSFKDEVCKLKSSYECFKYVFMTSNQKAAFSNTGCILMTAVGATIIFKDKIKNDIRSSLESGLQVVELSRIVSKSIHKESQIEFILPQFPINEIKLIPEDVKAKLDSVVIEEDSQITDLMFGFNPVESGASINKSILEAYYLKKIENDIIAKFDASIEKKSKSIKEKLLNKLNDQKTVNGLKREEIESYRVRLNEI